MKKLILAVAFLALAACGGNQLTQTVSYSCVGMTGALKVLTVARQEGKLSTDAVSIVNQAVDIVDPYCGAPNPPTMDSVTLTAFNQARDLLLAKLDEVSK